VYLPTFEYYLYGDIYVCTIVRKAMTLKQFEKIGHDLHLNNKNTGLNLVDNNCNIFYKAIQALDIIKKFKEYHSPSHDLLVDKAMTGFRERFYLKQHVPRNPPKWGIKAWGLTDSSNCYLLNCQIYQKEET
jgi:hypothetical protein